MKWWPWIGIGRLTDAQDEIRFLRERVAFLEDRWDRRQRFDVGMAEQPREPRAPPDPMPPELKAYIASWGTTHTIHELSREVAMRHRNGEPWDKIKADIMKPREAIGGES